MAFSTAPTGKPPPFAAQSYWDQRFLDNPDPYDWLQPATIFDPPITEALSLLDDPKAARLLHIGCGTSMLSFHLRGHVQDPSQIQNIDYSAEAVAWGRKKESELFGFDVDEEDMTLGEASSGRRQELGIVDTDPEDLTDDQASITEALEDIDLSASKPDKGKAPMLAEDIVVPIKQSNGKRSSMVAPSSQLEMPMTIWTQTSLLSLDSVIATCTIGGYELIIDKSCCDAIACDSDSEVPIPYFLYCDSGKGKATDPSVAHQTGPAQSNKTTEQCNLHPLNLFAVHLALLAKPGARWIALSYSSDRWPFFRDISQASGSQYDQTVPQALLDRGFPDPARLWRLVSKTSLESQYAMADENGIHRPASYHYLYILERTEVELKVRGT